MYPTYVYTMTKKQYDYYFTDAGGRIRSKKELIEYISQTSEMFGECVDIKVED